MSCEREEISQLINTVREAGARQSAACEVIGISTKINQCRRLAENGYDGRFGAKNEPKNKLTVLKRQCIIYVSNEPVHVHLPSGKIVTLGLKMLPVTQSA